MSQPPTTDNSSTPPPRTLARGTGLLLQSIGMGLFLSTCCVCALAGRWDPVMSRDVLLEKQREGTILDWSLVDLAAQPNRAGMMLLAMFMTVGGLSFVVFGLGMQSEKRGSATGALMTTVLALLILVVSGAGLWAGHAAWLAKAWHAAMTLMVLAMAPLVFASWGQMLRDPPDPDLYHIPSDFDVETYKRQLRNQPPLSPQQAADRRAILEAEIERLRHIEKNGKNSQQD